MYIVWELSVQICDYIFSHAQALMTHHVFQPSCLFYLSSVFITGIVVGNQMCLGSIAEQSVKYLQKAR